MTPCRTIEPGSSPGPGAAAIFGSFLRLGIAALVALAGSVLSIVLFR